MTDLLYNKDAYIKEFQAKVLSCAETDSGFALELDRTAFFPEQGGQYADEGTAGGLEVKDVQIKSGTVYHYIEKPIETGTTIKCSINFEKRFDRMQNHTGEHILCGIIHKMKGYENVGFHLSDELMTMDIDGLMTEKELEIAEKKANEVIWQNVPVEILYPEPDELNNIFYRAKLDIRENVRLVKIGDTDTCACCAPHVKSTGEIGMIKIIKAVKYKGGMRFNVSCGKRALEDYKIRYDETESVSRLLSVKPSEIIPAVEILNDKLNLEKNRVRELQKSLIEEKIRNIFPKKGNIAVKTEGADTDLLRYAVNLGIEKCDGVFFAYAEKDEKSFTFVMGKRGGDFGEDGRKILADIGGKGGGRGNVIAGVVTNSEENIEEYFK